MAGAGEGAVCENDTERRCGDGGEDQQVPPPSTQGVAKDDEHQAASDAEATVQPTRCRRSA